MAPCWKEEGHASTGLAKCSNIVFGLHSDHSPSASLFAGFGHGGWPGVGLPGGSDSKDSACSEEDLGLIPGLGGSPGGGHDNPLQYSCLENPHGQRSLVGYSPWGHKEPDMTKHSTALCVWLYLRACMSVYSFMRLRGMYYSYYKRGILRLREKNLKAFQQVRSWGLKWTIPPPTASLCSQVLPASHQNKV